uniref:hypothetical protein n=1 Tax=Burkholderia anthina TaxID=179879 RepID=UPI00158CD8D6|nr:hypothetical protein [Burkholderia anthina]
MISLKGRHPSAPAKLALDSQAAANSVLTKATHSALPILEESDFPNYWGRYKHHFIKWQYDGKCAYCETPVVSGTPGDVEHFRPKAYCQPLGPAANRDDYGGQPPARKNAAPPTEGYWWLAYTWTNYLLSCNRCNATWKRNQFPVQGARAGHGDRLSAERALLINPFEMDPEPHFAFDARTGQIRGLTPRGKATIDVCGLDRRSLEVQRATKGAKLKKRYVEYLEALHQNNVAAQNNALKALLDECRSKEPYAALARYFVKHELKIGYPALLAMKRLRKI